MIADADVIAGNFYWVIEGGGRARPPIQLVAQAWRGTDGVLFWEMCGSDEGANVVAVICAVTPPSPEPTS
jgi:hypothetical protein